MVDFSLEALFGVKGKNVVITGGSKGIGYMLASAFVQQGCQVFIFSRKPDEAAAKALNDQGPGKCTSYACDVADQDAIQRVKAQVESEIGDQGLHCLINNSGAVWAESFDTTSKSSFDKLMNVNVTGLFFVTQAFGPMLEKAASKEDPSRVINIASIDGLGIPTFEEYAYTASKAAVLHLTRALAGHNTHKHITFNCISPGLFPSKMGDQVLKVAGDEVLEQSIPMGRAGRPQEIAAAALFLAGPGGTYTTGANIVIDGGMLVKPRM
ncbi:Rhamnolipids biosynthesis 3-oxoacyl-[acyl-carrier-protein] reductase (3-ketoacyl-acyl carrier protein reductase) [Durusdinium trenchii]|uniref:Rhamnolipids biosynthesis 3-oxoacyl-[acyl-carrier-protein] reductase (3-ketoacyl-acyl carrier protein reductase) n=1 Tax=Durusdinium trenchii TaxID=1381693 RepID=A0ABP0HYE5_9DINO